MKYQLSFNITSPLKIKMRVAPLKIETRRYACLLIENRICFNHACHINNCIKDEKHVILDCPVYEELRHYLFNHACMYNNKFVSLSDADQFIFVFTNENMCYYSDKICYEISMRGKHIFYR